VDELRDLWRALHQHHRAMVGTLPLADHDELSWQRRRGLHLPRLGSANGSLALPTDGEGVIGYATVLLGERTWKLPRILDRRLPRIAIEAAGDARPGTHHIGRPAEDVA
jgi:hypothetical protein